MAKKHKKLSDQFREAILQSEKSRYRISQETGITQAALSRFVNRVSGMSLDSLDKVGQCLGLSIVIEQRSTKTRGR